MLKILVIGATSAIGHSTARNFARDGAAFYLVARNQAKLDTVADDLRALGARDVQCETLDMNTFEQHAPLLERAKDALGGMDVLLMAHGTLGDQQAIQNDYDAVLHELNTNFLSAASLLTHAAPHFEQQRRGVITVVTSVAADRGRASNYVYGTAMAAKTAFLSGLRNRLAKSGVQVITVKPGFVDTPMTAHMTKTPLFADVEAVGKDIYKGMRSGRDVIYTPFFWRYIMWIIRLIPEPIFKRLSL